MSNPAVINLVNIRKKHGNLRRLDIEDNIGESIHIHINNFRLDMTIQEFLEFADNVTNSSNKLMKRRGIDLMAFDSSFINKIAHLLVDIEKIEIKYLPISQLKVVTHHSFLGVTTLSLPHLIQNSHAYKYLKGSVSSFLAYQQDSHLGISNDDRLRSLKLSIEHNGYPSENRYVILFNNQKIIRDGQHRASILASMYGLDHLLPVQILTFRRSNGNYSNVKSLICSARNLIKYLTVKVLLKLRQR